MVEDIQQDVLSVNNSHAKHIRAWAQSVGVTVLNLISSPGSGKTTLLEHTVAALASSRDVCVIEGDQQTSNDACRIQAAGARAVQINTQDGCHLEAAQVQQAIDLLAPQAGGLLFIENVGNLVCPTFYDLGEQARVVLASVTEGEDKPLKYPRAFETADVCIVTKCDLLPYLDFDVELLERNTRAINPHIRIMRAEHGASPEWEQWLRGLDA